jgi:pyruvate dehydrogenase E1 component beta subunit
MRPIIEMRIFDFVMCAMDELVNQIAKVRYMFGGQASPPWWCACRTACGAIPPRSTRRCSEAWFAHLPGVGRGDARRRRPIPRGCWCRRSVPTIPVLFFDPKDLFWQNGEIAEPIEPIPVRRGAPQLPRAMPPRW